MQSDITGGMKSPVEYCISGRKFLLLHLTSVSALLGTARGVSAEPRMTIPGLPVVTFADPSDGPRRGRGRPYRTRRKTMTVADPRDEAGRGHRRT
jgi:hypothetical protein